MEKNEWLAKHSIPADYTASEIMEHMKERGADRSPEFEDLLELGTYRGSCWQPAEADVGIGSGSFEEIEFEDYPEWAKEILDECDGEFLSTLHEREAERHQEDDRW